MSGAKQPKQAVLTLVIHRHTDLCMYMRAKN